MTFFVSTCKIWFHNALSSFGFKKTGYRLTFSGIRVKSGWGRRKAAEETELI